MHRRGPFEKRLLVALVLFSLVPSLLLVGVGTFLLSETLALQASPSSWSELARSGRELLERADASGDPALRAAAERHRTELGESLLQAGRWEYLNQRALRVIPFAALLLVGVLLWLAVRAARGIAREMARPIRELVGWSERIAREEPLPAATRQPEGERSEFGALRDAFRRMERELATSRARALEAERARTWVTIARSVAHELKNALTPLRLGVSALERLTPAGGAAREPLEVVASESLRLEELARAFSQLGRMPEGNVSEIDLAEQLDYLLRTHLPPQVQHRLRAPVDLPRLRGHHDALARAFANILLNAVEAMGPGGGTITVQATTVARAVEIRLQDTGPGIDPAHLEAIWEPDFTTKPRGTGLGLALVRQTVQAHGGSVAARNRAGGGAEFRVLLPLQRNASPAAVAAPEPRPATLDG
jgi:signal transduction histidine kinase